MKTNKHPDFKADAPEMFDSNLIDSRSLGSLFGSIAIEVRTERWEEPEDRHLTPGLRRALNIIAEITDVV